MSQLMFRKIDGDVVCINGRQIVALDEATRGVLIAPGHSEYHSARSVWNCMIDKRPTLVVRCYGVSDVIQCVNFATEHRLLVSVRGGSHNLAGTSVCDGGLVIDLSRMDYIRVDPETKTAVAGAGMKWSDFDRETQAFKLATVGGTVSSTGISGLSLGGGIGWLTRKYGLTCDNILAVDIVTADGKIINASNDNHSELFWALRGAGGNFGVVTAIKYGLHPVDAMYGGMVIYPASDARDVLNFYRSFSQDLPHEGNTIAALMNTPDGSPALGIVVSFQGIATAAERALKPLTEFGNPMMTDLGPRTYLQIQGILDPLFPEGRRSYLKSGFVDSITDACIDGLIDHGFPLPSPLSFIAFQQLGGAASEVPVSETSFSHRSARYDLLIHSVGLTPQEDSKNIEWTRNVWNAIEPEISEGVYLNNLGGMDDDSRLVAHRAWSTSSLKRLKEIKSRYDPVGFFRHNTGLLPDR